MMVMMVILSSVRCVLWHCLKFVNFVTEVLGTMQRSLLESVRGSCVHLGNVFFFYGVAKHLSSRDSAWRNPERRVCAHASHLC